MPNLFSTNYAARDGALYNMVSYVSGRYTPAAGTPTAVKIGRIPAGSVITEISSRVITAITGTTPVLGIGTAANLVGANGNLQAVMSEAVVSENLVPSTTVPMPLAADTDIWIGNTGTATAGDVIVAVCYINPVQL
jgi:hypothetical protein